MIDDDRMDDLIRAAAAEYNRPPAVPRDEMWAAIETRRAATAGAASAAAPSLYVVPTGPAGAARRSALANVRSETRSTRPRFGWWSLAAAAVLLIATGVGVGRWTAADGNVAEPRAVATATPRGAALPAEGAGLPAAGGDTQTVPNAPHTVASRADIGDSDPSATPARDLTPVPASTLANADRPSPQRLVARGRQSGLQRDSEGLGSVAPGSQSVIPYQVATIRHLTDAEALLTSFTLESRDERTDSRLAGWAKGLLSNTRLLLDSPAGDDPRRAKLLEDLELVLAQIVQLSPGAAAKDRDLVHGSIRNGAVMTRLRTAIPAGPTRGF